MNSCGKQSILAQGQSTVSNSFRAKYTSMCVNHLSYVIHSVPHNGSQQGHRWDVLCCPSRRSHSLTWFLEFSSWHVPAVSLELFHACHWENISMIANLNPNQNRIGTQLLANGIHYVGNKTCVLCTLRIYFRSKWREARLTLSPHRSVSCPFYASYLRSRNTTRTYAEGKRSSICCLQQWTVASKMWGITFAWRQCFRHWRKGRFLHFSIGCQKSAHFQACIIFLPSRNWNLIMHRILSKRRFLNLKGEPWSPWEQSAFEGTWIQ